MVRSDSKSNYGGVNGDCEFDTGDGGGDSVEMGGDSDDIYGG